jgi:hypothetical protein
MKDEHDDPEMSDQRALDEFERRLQALLRAEPSAAVAANVRTRLAEARPARRPWRTVAAALAAGLVVILLTRALARQEPPPAPRPREATVDRRATAPAIAAPRARAVARTVLAHKRAPGGQPEVVVEPGQEEALLRFVARQGERTAAPPPLIAFSSRDAPLAPPHPIENTPLEPTPSSLIADPPARSDS